MNLILPAAATMGDIKVFAERLNCDVKHTGFDTIEFKPRQQSDSNVRVLRRPTSSDSGPSAA